MTCFLLFKQTLFLIYTMQYNFEKAFSTYLSVSIIFEKVSILYGLFDSYQLRIYEVPIFAENIHSNLCLIFTKVKSVSYYSMSN